MTALNGHQRDRTKNLRPCLSSYLRRSYRRRQHSFVCGRKASVVSINNSFIAFFFSFSQQPPLSSHPVMVGFNKSQLNPLRQKARNQPGLNNLMRKTNINVKADPIKTCFPSRVCVRMYGSLPNTLSMSGL